MENDVEDNPTNNQSPKDESEESAQETSGETASANPDKELAAKLQNDILYLKADFENYKKRMIKEKSDLSKYGSESLIASLLDLLDNFERAISIEIKPDNVQSFSDGIKMISTEFKNILSRYGVTEVPSLGQPFDPSYHEALGSEPTNDTPSGHISKVFSKPYKLHDRLVRPGRVIVAAPPKEGE